MTKIKTSAIVLCKSIVAIAFIRSISPSAAAQDEKPGVTACESPPALVAAIKDIYDIGPEGIDLSTLKSDLFDLIFSATPPDQTLLCERPAVDRLVIVGQRPPQTLLTAAVDSANYRVITLIINYLAKNGGNIYQPNGENRTAEEIIKSNINILLKSHTTDEVNKLVASLSPPQLRTYKGAYPELFWNSLTTSGSVDASTPDATNAPPTTPQYVSDLIQGQNGVSIGYKLQDGKPSPQVQGELRYEFADNHLWTQPSRSDYEYAFIDTNLNKNKSPGTPSSPDWLSGGVAYRIRDDLHLLGLVPIKKDPLEYYWSETIFKIGSIQNRAPSSLQDYIFINYTNVSYFPLWSLNSVRRPANDPGTGVPLYGSATFGAQLQRKMEQPTYGIPNLFEYGRIDVYLYPCMIIPDCLSSIANLGMNPNGITMHADVQAVDRDGGHMQELGISWAFRPKQTLSLTRSVGNQDPSANFGSPLKKSGQANLALKFSN